VYGITAMLNDTDHVHELVTGQNLENADPDLKIAILDDVHAHPASRFRLLADKGIS
jgi:hypothetical protein